MAAEAGAPPARRRLRPGKVPWELVAAHLAADLPPEVRLGPACGEDAALIFIGGELWAVASDPVSFTTAGAGRLAVTVNANDVAVRGARPRFFTAVVLLAPGEDAAAAGALLDEIAAACAGLDVALIGGHTEVTPGLAHGLVVGTMLGRVEGRAVTTGGLRPGDRVGLVGWAGLEGTSILLAELGDRLHSRLDAGALAELERALAGDWLSVVTPALAAAGVAGVSSLHDVTEGGVGEALHEMGAASGLRVEVEPEAVPVLGATRGACAALGLDPLGLIGSGGLLVGCAEAEVGNLKAALATSGRPLRWIGRATRGRPGCTGVPRFPRDEILRVHALDGVEAVIFDMDGTLVDSPYDWPAIRRRLGVTDRSLIDGIESLPEPGRSRAWRELEAVEAEATRRATLLPGARELLAFLARRGLATALVTNNSAANARALLERFGLAFDAVVTRDDGVHKPSGAPLAAACRRLGVSPAACLVVGDSHYDLEAAADAGCARTCILHRRARELRDAADLAFADIRALLAFLEIVL